MGSPPTLCRWEHAFLASSLAEEVIGPPSKLGGAVETPAANGMPGKPRMSYCHTESLMDDESFL